MRKNIFHRAANAPETKSSANERSETRSFAFSRFWRDCRLEEKMVFVVFGCVFIAFARFEYSKSRAQSPAVLFYETPVVTTNARGQSSAKNPVSSGILVHVAGKVRRAGLVKLAPGARVYEAIAAAGGATDAKAANLLNLAAPLHDGDKVFVGTPILSSGTLSETTNRVLETRDATTSASLASAKTAAKTSRVSKSKTLPSQPINLNSASVAELQQLPGIGPAMAERIVAARQQQRFNRIEDLDSVKGIGLKKLEKMRPFVAF